MKPKSEMSLDSRSGVQVISRAVTILRSLKHESEGLSLGQIAERVHLPRSTVQRIVGALQSEHMVIAAGPGGGIRLGPEISSLAESAHIDIGELLRPYLVDLARATGETVDLAMMRGRRLVFLDQISGHHRLRTVSSVGESFPLFNTANGKACLALLDAKRIEKLLVTERPDLAVGEAARKLWAELDAVRADRLAFDRDQHTQGISAVGVAFRDLQGEIYAISIPTPSARFEVGEDTLVAHLLRTLDQIERLEVMRGPDDQPRPDQAHTKPAVAEEGPAVPSH